MSDLETHAVGTGMGSALHDPHVPCARRMSAMRAAVLCGLSILAGLVVAIVGSLAVVFPLIGTGSVDQDRKIALGRAVESGVIASANALRRAVFLGDSVSVDGIDAAIVEHQAGAGWRVFNFAIRGCNRTGLDVIAPAFIASKPDLVVLVLQPDMSIAQFELPEDSAYAYALGGFPSFWPEGWMEPVPPGIPAESMQALLSGSIEGRLHFRNSPQVWINGTLRERFRPGVRVPASDDWIAPFVRTASISGSTLEINLERVKRETLARRELTTVADRDDLARLLREFAVHHVQLLVVGAPAHPQLRETFDFDRTTLRDIVAKESSRSSGAIAYIDAFELLDEDGFSDALHPNREGREALSRFVGNALRTTWAAKEGG